MYSDSVPVGSPARPPDNAFCRILGRIWLHIAAPTPPKMYPDKASAWSTKNFPWYYQQIAIEISPFSPSTYVLFRSAAQATQHRHGSGTHTLFSTRPMLTDGTCCDITSFAICSRLNYVCHSLQILVDCRVVSKPSPKFGDHRYPQVGRN